MFLLLVLLIGTMAPASPVEDEKLKPEELIAKHLDRFTRESPDDQNTARGRRGSCGFWRRSGNCLATNAPVTVCT
jgi:hypothetical protein